MEGDAVSFLSTSGYHALVGVTMAVYFLSSLLVTRLLKLFLLFLVLRVRLRIYMTVFNSNQYNGSRLN